MTYSVWDQGLRAYRYYETPGSMPTVNAPKPAHVGNGGRLGVSPERAAWPLPAGARETGTGYYPRGHVAVRRRGGLGDILDPTPGNVLLWGALGLMAYHFLWKPSQKRSK